MKQEIDKTASNGLLEFMCVAIKTYKWIFLIHFNKKEGICLCVCIYLFDGLFAG